MSIKVCYMEKHEHDLVLNLNAYGVGAVTFD
jgi:hypothetical protein